MPPVLQIKSLCKAFGGLKAVDHCNFEIEENSITGLIGPNGAGKTTMFDLISGLLQPDAGHIIFHYEDITRIALHKRASRGIMRTFQNIRIFPELTALENIIVAFPEYPDKFLDIFTKVSSRVKALHKRGLDLLKTVQLDELAHHPAGSLSYGQKKLLEILRCVATGADLLLLDEPAAGVNRTMLHHIIDLIKLLKKEGKTILIVEHDMGFVMTLCQQIIVMEFGKDIASGTPAEIQNNKQVLEAYLGKS